MSDDICMCLAYDPTTGEEGWRPCPARLCEREHAHYVCGAAFCDDPACAMDHDA